MGFITKEIREGKDLYAAKKKTENIELAIENGATEEQADAIAVLMDDETREKVHHELAPCEPVEFSKRYCELDPSFEAVLKDEFSIEI